MADDDVFEEPNFVLQKGAMLPVARLVYKTVGTLNAARDNAVLVPSWYTGTHNDTGHTCLARRGHSIRGDILSS
jgi:homoserine O-acetyltransferase/O-succinyltransferase